MARVTIAAAKSSADVRATTRPDVPLAAFWPRTGGDVAL